jgi:hypothetical protein
MTMAGMFYVISGSVNGLMFAGRIRKTEGRGVGKLVVGGAVTGLWLLVLHFLYRILLMNGFTSTDGETPPEYPVGLLTGWVRTGEPVPFYWHQVTEPGTLSIIGWILILVSLILGLLFRAGGYLRVERNIRTLVLLGAAVLFLSPVAKFQLYPVYDSLLEAERYVSATLVGHVTHLFGVFPYLGFGLFGAAAGILITSDGDRRVLRFLKRASFTWLGIGVAGLLATIPLDSEVYPLVRQVQGACVAYLELALFLFLTRFGLKRWDYAPDPTRVRQAWFFHPIRRFAALTLTVYLLEPVVAELFDHALAPVFASWKDSLGYAFVLALVCAAFWLLLLSIWERFGYRGSTEWQGAAVMRLLTGKKSTKLNREPETPARV